MEKWDVETVMGNWDKRRNMENSEEDVRTCEKCDGADVETSRYL